VREGIVGAAPAGLVEQVERFLETGLPKFGHAALSGEVVVAPTDLLTVAYQRMKLYDVSQLPVMEGERIVGILDESDVLMHVYGDEARFRDPVSTAMITSLDIVDVMAPVESLMPIFDRGHVAIVMDGERFLGLITRIDLLNWLRRRVQ